jgi:hypothetical protein
MIYTRKERKRNFFAKKFLFLSEKPLSGVERDKFLKKRFFFAKKIFF